MGRKEEYKEKNLQYLQVLSTQEGICPLPCNMFYKVLQTGTGTVSPTIRSIVTVHYRGSLINGKSLIIPMTVTVPKLSGCVMS